MRPALSCRRARTGFTLIELMVVITIIGILTAVMIPEMTGSFQDALLRSTSRELVNVFELANSRAVSLNEARRVRLDESTGRYLMEREIQANGEPDFTADDAPGGEGKLDSRITVEFRQPMMNVSEENAAAPAPAAGQPPATIAFYPDGTADAGEILLTDRQGFRLLLQINPVTARVHVVSMERETPP